FLSARAKRRISTLPPLHGCSPSPREGQAGRGGVGTEIVHRISPLPDPLPTPSSWGEGNIPASPYGGTSQMRPEQSPGARLRRQLVSDPVHGQQMCRFAAVLAKLCPQ